MLAAQNPAAAPHLHNVHHAQPVQHQPIAQPAQQQAAGVNIFLKPYAYPSALGWAAFFGSSWLLGTYLARWYGGNFSFPLLLPMLGVFGGVAQFMAGMRGHQTRDNWATVFHVTWGSFFIAFSLFQLFRIIGLYNPVLGITSLEFLGGNDEWGNVMVVMAAITFFCMIAALGRDVITFLTTMFAFIASVLMMAGFFADDVTSNYRTIKAGGYMLLIASVFALWRSAAYLMEEAFERVVLPVFHTRRHMAKPYVQVPVGEPGVKKGQ